MHIYIFEDLFSKIQSMNLALALQTQFLEWRLPRFGKELFICIITLTKIYTAVTKFGPGNDLAANYI